MIHVFTIQNWEHFFERWLITLMAALNLSPGLHIYHSSTVVGLAVVLWHVCFFFHSIITTFADMTHYADRFELKEIHFSIVKINLYNMYLQDYWNQKELSDSKILEIERVWILKTRLVRQLFMLVRRLEYVPFSAVSVLCKESVFIRYPSMRM